MIASGRIEEVRVGVAAPLDGTGIVTGYRKYPVAGGRVVHETGIEGDVQVHKKVHGGPEKAVYAYPLAGYDLWRAEFPDLAPRLGPGAMGENLVVAGLDEASVCLGDHIACGSAVLQIAQPRQPCDIFAASLGTPKVVRAMARSARCGWYLRVLQPGTVAAGDAHDVVERPNPDWTMARFAALIVAKAPAVGDLAEIAALPGLTRQWQLWAAQRLASA
ncbi:hypothetical protein IP88_08960 [alpha proteobacterium AAP81b]|nr:hypothetical protein IP88_08960 [alpha proteobacterium AAP81b]